MNGSARGIIHIAMTALLLIITVAGVGFLNQVSENTEQLVKVTEQQQQQIDCLVLLSKGEMSTCE